MKEPPRIASSTFETVSRAIAGPSTLFSRQSLVRLAYQESYAGSAMRFAFGIGLGDDDVAVDADRRPVRKCRRRRGHRTAFGEARLVGVDAALGGFDRAQGREIVAR